MYLIHFITLWRFTSFTSSRSKNWNWNFKQNFIFQYKTFIYWMFTNIISTTYTNTNDYSDNYGNNGIHFIKLISVNTFILLYTCTIYCVHHIIIIYQLLDKSMLSIEYKNSLSTNNTMFFGCHNISYVGQDTRTHTHINYNI